MKNYRRAKTWNVVTEGGLLFTFVGWEDLVSLTTMLQANNIKVKSITEVSHSFVKDVDV